MRSASSLVLALVVLGGTANVAQAQQPNAAERERALQAELRSERPIAAFNSVWLEELTWMEVRDAMAAGTRTVIVPTGGIEQNGPYLALGKHNYVLEGACEGIARELGDALCAPIVKFVPEGGIENPTGHMRYPGTISLKEETYRQMLDDIVSSLAAHGFENVVLIGDSGGNQRGMGAVAEAVNQRLGKTVAHFVPEFYRYADAFEFMETELGISEPTSDGIHDDFVITSLMMLSDPQTVRYDERVAAGKATINGLSIAPKEETLATGRRIMEFRVNETVRAIRASIGS